MPTLYREDERAPPPSPPHGWVGHTACMASSTHHSAVRLCEPQSAHSFTALVLMARPRHGRTPDRGSSTEEVRRDRHTTLHYCTASLSLPLPRTKKKLLI